MSAFGNNVGVARLFLAVWPPAAVVDRLRTLPRPEQPGVRWVAPERWHVTLRFLGAADPADVDACLAGRELPPAEASLGPAVSRLGRSVVVVPVGGLDRLADAVCTATATIGRPPDPRPFAGHLTLARLKHRAACGVAGTPVRASFRVKEVALVESATSGPDLRYRTIGRYLVGGVPGTP